MDQGKELDALSLDELRQLAPEIDEDVFQALSIEAALKAKSTFGGTAPTNVAAALDEAERYLDDP